MKKEVKSMYYKCSGVLKSRRMIGASVGAMLLWTTPASATLLQVYFNNFDSAPVLGGGTTGGLSGFVSIQGVQGFSGLGSTGNQFSGNLLRNDTGGNPANLTRLILNNLPAHNSLDINFLLAIIDSWDSIDGSASPDFFNVILDGVTLLQHTYANASGTITNTTGTDIGSGCQNRGFNSFCDRAFDASTEAALNVAHTASTATIDFFASGAGWQGGFDESWGIDNLQVTINTVDDLTVPEPSSISLLGLGALGLISFRWQRRKKNFMK